MSSSDPAPDDNDSVPYIAHSEFRAGLPFARFRVVVNPTLARPYVMQRTRMTAVAIVVIGLGAVLALAGQAWAGVALVGSGIVLNRIVKHQAGKIVLHLALNDAAVYREVTGNGVMEVRHAQG
jgi:hypothetical protein